MTKIKLNLGCGQVRPIDWINTDSSMNAFIQRLPLGTDISKVLGGKTYEDHNVIYMNLNKRWSRFSAESIDIVYASHLFEHLSIRSTDIFLSESFRALKTGGTIRLVMPDMFLHAKEYVQQIETGNVNALVQFMWALNLHREGQYPIGNFFHSLLGWIQGWPHQHKFMYDKYSLSKLLTHYGFVNIKESSFGTSFYINEINDVENSGGYANSLYLEAKKP